MFSRNPSVSGVSTHSSAQLCNSHPPLTPSKHLPILDYTAVSALAASMMGKYQHVKEDGPQTRKETWSEVAHRVAFSVVQPYFPHLVGRLTQAIEQRKFLPGGRYLYASGRRDPFINNCYLLSAEDSREGPGGWAEVMHDTTHCLMVGGGVGVTYNNLRGEGQLCKGLGGLSTGPLALMNMVNESGRYIRQGGSRRSALWAGLIWWHPDVFKFIHMKDWSETLRECKAKDYTFSLPMDGTNISVILDDDFFSAYKDPTWSKTYKNGSSSYTVDHKWAQRVYWSVVRQMVKTGEPGFSVDTGANKGKHNRNACTEVDSADNRDMCNLASINLARISSKEEFAELVQLGTMFLMCGTLYSKLPISDMYKIREKNRRLGLGLMGMHEWLLRRNKVYKVDSELETWLEYYTLSTQFAKDYSNQLGISCPVATRSIAPTGTISMVGETTSGVEPLPSVAYKRRYLKGETWMAQYTIESVAARLISQGVDPDCIEDSFTLAEDIERRVEFQAWLQQYVDHGISSTINLPQWGSSLNNENTVEKFGNTLMKYLPMVRGMTAYPDGARGGQPITRVPYYEAIKRGVGVEFIDNCDVMDASAQLSKPPVSSAQFPSAEKSTVSSAELSNYHTSSEDSMIEAHSMIGYSCKSGVCGE